MPQSHLLTLWAAAALMPPLPTWLSPVRAIPGDWIAAAVQVMGGEARLRGLQSIRLTGLFEENGIAWSPRAAQPRPNFEQFTELRDLVHQRVRRSMQFQAASRSVPLSYAVVANVPDSAAMTVFAGRGAGPGSMINVKRALDRFEYSPEWVLRDALSATDLQALPDTIIDREHYHTVSLHHGAVRLLINAATSMPYAVELRDSRAADPNWTMWGDLVTRCVWSSWSLEPNGVRYPRTWTVYRNGHWLERYAIFGLEFNVPTPEDSLSISDSIRARMARSAITVDRLVQSAKTLADGVVLLSGGFNVVLVHQLHGVVVIETPISADFSRTVLASATRLFPGLPVTAVVVSDFMWAHFGGVREYIARGIPIYAAPGPDVVIRRVATAPHRQEPDSLARAPRPLRLTVVTDRTVLGTGPNQVQLLYARIPGTEYGEQMLVAYLPGRRFLYAGDLLPTVQNEANFVREGAAAVASLISRARLDVDSVFGIHRALTAWRPIADSLAVVAGP